jgi:hypothetical protein
VRAARISAAGVVLDFNGFSVDPTSPRQEASAVVGRPGGGSLIAWQDSRMSVGQAADIHGARLETNGLSTPVGALSLAAPAQVRADAASGPGGGALLVWTSMLSGSTRVLGQLVTAQGQPVGEPLEVASGGTLGNAHVAWNGTVWLVTWDGPSGVFARRVGGDHAPLGPAFLVMPGSINDVAAQGDVFLVTALVPEPNPEYVNVRSRRVAASTGALLDASSVLVGSTYARAQAIEAFEGGFLLAWQRHATHDQPYSSILLRAISVDNVPGTQLSFTSTSSYNQMPALAAGDGTLLLTWQLGPESSTNQDVVARLIGPGPTLLGGAITVSAGPRSEQLPAAAWDGSEYLVSWQDLRATQDYLFDRRTDVYAARVTTAGAVLDPDGIPLAVDTVPEAWVATATLGPGAALVAWSDFQEWAPFASYRLAFSTLGELSPWMDLGAALAGSNGTPRLEGDGLLHAGTPMSLQLSAAPPLAPVTLILGFTALNAPFKGGTLVPHPDLLVAGLLSNASGGLTLGATWPAAVPPGTALFLQAWIRIPRARRACRRATVCKRSHPEPDRTLHSQAGLRRSPHVLGIAVHPPRPHWRSSRRWLSRSARSKRRSSRSSATRRASTPTSRAARPASSASPSRPPTTSTRSARSIASTSWATTASAASHPSWPVCTCASTSGPTRGPARCSARTSSPRATPSCSTTRAPRRSWT